MQDHATPGSSVTAREAVTRGFVPIPIKSDPPASRKMPLNGDWTHTRWASEEEAFTAFEGFAADPRTPARNVGLLLGAPSGGLVDIDLDHPKTRRLADYFLPYTPMRSGRPANPRSHYWYLCKPGTLRPYQKYTMPQKEDGKAGDVILEYRSTGGQSLIPPSLHVKGEHYVWEGEPWGGDAGPLLIDGRVLQTQAALLALGTLLIDSWPVSGAGMRHEAYLALAGGLLRLGEGQVHPWWRRNAPVLIGAMADATNDNDGGEARVKEVMTTTIRRILEGRRRVAGFGKLATLIGDKTVDQLRVLLGDVEASAGLPTRQEMRSKGASPEYTQPVETDYGTVDPGDEEPEADEAEGSDEEYGPKFRDPLADRPTTWSATDLEPYLSGQVVPVQPSLFMRDDGQFLMYPGRVNMLFGSSESAKSWIMLEVCRQVISVEGGRALYVDFEDEPVETLARMFALGTQPEDLRHGTFAYVRPEGPMADMQRNRWGGDDHTTEGIKNYEAFQQVLKEVDPTLIVLDGMTVLYGLHGLDTNDSTATDVITSWLKKLTDDNKRTVVVIDHTGKSPVKGSLPIGSQHKQAMVQGTMLQAWMISQPMPGSLGQVDLIVVKDRPGQVRRASVKKSGNKQDKAQLAAEVFIDSRPEDQREAPADKSKPRPATILSIRAPSGASASPGDTVTVDLRETNEQKLRTAHQIVERHVIHVFRGDIELILTTDEVLSRVILYQADISREDVFAALRRMSGTQNKGEPQPVEGEYFTRLGGNHPKWQLRIGPTDDADPDVLDEEAVRHQDATEPSDGVVVPPDEVPASEEAQDDDEPHLGASGLSVAEFAERWDALPETDEYGRSRRRQSVEHFGVSLPTIDRWLKQARAAGHTL